MKKPENITVGECLAKVTEGLTEAMEAHRSELSKATQSISSTPGGFFAGMQRIQAATDLDQAFFNPQFGVDYDLRAALGPNEQLEISISDARKAIEDALKSRAKRLKSVTQGTLNPDSVDEFAAKLLTRLEAKVMQASKKED